MPMVACYFRASQILRCKVTQWKQLKRNKTWKRPEIEIRFPISVDHVLTKV